MKRHFLTVAVANCLLLSGATTAGANDLVDFLRAVQVGSSTRTAHRGHHHDSHGHSAHVPVLHDRGHSHGIHGGTGYDLSTRARARRYAYRNSYAPRSSYGVYQTSPSITISTSLNSDRRLRENPLLYRRPYVAGISRPQDVYPPIYDAPATPVPGSPIVIPPSAGSPYPNTHGLSITPAPILPPAVHLPHQFGEIVDCAVPLYPDVHVEDPENIAPHAVHVVVAVRDPNLCDHKCDCCIPRCVYVPVCVPDCPPRSIKVSSCGTRLKMDFGKYEVEITSRDGCIEIDYDD